MDPVLTRQFGDYPVALDRRQRGWAQRVIGALTPVTSFDHERVAAALQMAREGAGP